MLKNGMDLYNPWVEILEKSELYLKSKDYRHNSTKCEYNRYIRRIFLEKSELYLRNKDYRRNSTK